MPVATDMPAPSDVRARFSATVELVIESDCVPGLVKTTRPAWLLATLPAIVLAVIVSWSPCR